MIFHAAPTNWLVDKRSEITDRLNPVKKIWLFGLNTALFEIIDAKFSQLAVVGVNGSRYWGAGAVPLLSLKA
jgi:hypothetical protein